MIAILTMGFLLGMRHALDPDHLIAVTVLGAQREARASGLLRHALAWGFGHASMLLALSAVIVLGQGEISPGLSAVLQAVAAGVLVTIGVSTLWRLRSSAMAAAPLLSPVTIPSSAALPASAPLASSVSVPALRSSRHSGDSQHLGRTLVIGLTQGLAGSAALLVVAVSTMREPALSMLYVLLFGIGSMAGMMALAGALTLPLARVAARSERLYRALSLAAGVFAIVLGLATLAARA
jgi:cytochrome c biogenesis protein CcdA